MKNLDETLEYMENARFNYLYADVVSQMTKETGFSETEVTCLVMIYHKFVLANNNKHCRQMNRSQMYVILQTMFNIADPELMHGIIDSMRSLDSEGVQTGDRRITAKSFVKLFDVYYARNLEYSIKFVFRIYDRTERGYLDREDVSRYVDKFFRGEDEDEIYELRTDMVELLLLKFDLDKDNVITFEEYSTVIHKYPDLLEFLGQIFPTRINLEVGVNACNLINYWEKHFAQMAD